MKLWQKYATTFSIYYCNWAVVIGLSYLGPAFMDIRDGLGSTTQTMSMVLTIGKCLAMASCLLAGFVYNHVDRHLAVIFLVFTTGAITVIMPHISQLSVFGSLFGVQLICVVGYFMAQVVWVMDMWKEEAEPFVQAQHFFGSLGGVFPALIFAPYLRSGGKSNSSPDNVKETALNETEVFPENVKPSLDHLFAPCTISGVICAAGSIFLLGAYFIRDKDTEKGSEKKEGNGQESNGTCSDDKNKEKNSQSDTTTREAEEESKSKEDLIMEWEAKKRKWIILALTSCLMSCLESVEGMTGYLPIFGAYSALELPASESAHLLTAFSTGFTVARALGIFIVLKVRPRNMLAGNLLIVAAGNLMLLFGGGNSRTWLFASATLLGIGLSTSTPSAYSYAQTQLHITNTVVSFVAVGTNVVPMVLPFVIGSIIETTPNILGYLNLGFVIAAIIVFVSLAVYIKIYGRSSNDVSTQKSSY